MFEAIFDSFRDKTVIYILHRLSSATFADRIYLLENGQIAEQGTHAELIALNGEICGTCSISRRKSTFHKGDLDRGLKNGEQRQFAAGRKTANRFQ